MVIAVDGPSGSGKSSVCKNLAKRLGYEHLDTGALYRTLTLYFIEKGFLNKEDVGGLFGSGFELKYDRGRVFMDGKDVSKEIRTPLVDSNVSYVSSLSFVRDFVNSKIREFGEEKNLLIDGRDIATVVVPDAKYKFFLDAKPEVRARRRFEERPDNMSYEEVLEAIKKRDLADSTREIAPLKAADDAVKIDTGELDIDEVADIIMGYIKQG